MRRMLPLLCMTLVVALVGFLTPSKSYVAVADEELGRLSEPVQRTDVLIQELKDCLDSLISQVPARKRVAIVTQNERVERELHVALGATGRAPSLFATSDWIVREVGDDFGSASGDRTIIECQGNRFVAEARRD
jgi:ABC-type cobalamin/Fe3+-siderophores transport system ATPase subunit